MYTKGYAFNISDELEAAVVKYYKNYRSIYKNKDALAKFFCGDLLVIAQVK